MPSFITNAVQVQRFADALYNVSVGTTTMAQVTSDITASGGLDNALNAYYTSSFAGVSTTTIAANMCTNLGIVAGQNGLVAADVTTAQNYITGTLNAAAANARGAAVKGILNNLSALTSDKVYGAVATKFNSDIDKATAYTGTADILAGTAPAPVVVSTFVLTTGTNNFIGSTGDDTFDGGLSTSSINTLNSGDVLNGLAGNDSLQAVINASVTPTLTSIENVTVTNVTTASVIDLANATGLVNFTNQASTVGLTISGIGKAVAVTVRDTTTAAQNINYNDVSGSADSATVTVANITGGNAGTLVIPGVETLTLNSTGSVVNAFGITTAQTKTLAIAGNKGLTLGTLGATITAIDASASTGTGADGISFTLGATTSSTITGAGGNDAITVGSSSGTDSINAGGGNDTVTFTANFSNTDSVSGGDGTVDTLTLVTANAAGYTKPTVATVSGFERIAISDVFTGGVTLTTADIQAGIERVNLVAGNTGADFIVMEAGARTVAFGAANGAGLLTISDTGTATSDSLTLVNSLATGDVFVAQGITVNGYETVNITTTSTGAAVTQTLGAITLAPDVGGTSTLNISGTNTATTAIVTANVIDASGLTGNAVLTMGNAAVSVTSITGGPGADTLVGDSSSYISGGAGNDTITGGSGNDTILGGDGNDTITNSGGSGDSVDGGAGNDTVTATLTAGNKIIGGDGTDTLSLALAVTAATAAGVSGFETFANTGAVTQDMIQFIDNPTFTRINLTAAVAATFSNVGSGITTLGLTTAASTVTGFTRLVDTANDTLSVVITGGIAAITAITTANENTINLSSSNASAVTVTDWAAAQVGTLNITGTGNVTITNAITANTSLATVNASVATGTVSLNGTNSVTNMTVTGGSGALTFTGGSGADSITGGDGTDLLTGGSGNDTITGGQGADTLVGGIGADNLTGGAGADHFRFAESIASGTPGPSRGDVVTDWTDGTDFIAVSAADTFAAAGNAGLSLSNGVAGSMVAAAAGTFVVSSMATATTAAATAATGLFKLTTPVATGDTEQAMFNAAIGAGNGYTAVTTASEFLVSLYNASTKQMVLLSVNSGGNTQLETGDIVTLIANVNMSATDYTNFTTADILCF